VQDKDNLGWNDHDSEIGYLTLMVTTEQSAVSQVRDQLKAMTLEEKSKLANQLGISKDF
jgi:antitoxin component HigA of HigAB toxin-antitoxin module